MSSPGIVQGMQQGMVATPAMQLAMRALQANQTELQELIAEALSTNPTLEEARPSEPDAAEEPSGTYYHRESGIETFCTQQSLAEHLEEQIRRSGLPPKQESAALTLIPWLDRHGYFAEPLAVVQQETGLPDKQFEQARHILCDLEPAGVGAQDLQESLILQLKRLGEHRGLPMRILQHHWQDLVKHRYARIANALDIDEEAAELAARRIARLNPDPGSGFSRTEHHIITPDICIEAEGNELKISLTREGSPQLALSAEYRELMAQHADNPEVRQFLSRCFREGRDFIRALQDRQTTLLLVAKAIAERQKNYFINSNAPLAPMKMEDIAADTRLHVSTISRAVRGKYIKSLRGVTELRALFTTAVSAETSGEISADAAKQRIRQLIEQEDPARPLSDARIESLLQAENISLARRTIAKYREQLKILPASLRKGR